MSGELPEIPSDQFQKINELMKELPETQKEFNRELFELLRSVDANQLKVIMEEQGKYIYGYVWDRAVKLNIAVPAEKNPVEELLKDKTQQSLFIEHLQNKGDNYLTDKELDTDSVLDLVIDRLNFEEHQDFIKNLAQDPETAKDLVFRTIKNLKTEHAQKLLPKLLEITKIPEGEILGSEGTLKQLIRRNFEHVLSENHKDAMLANTTIREALLSGRPILHEIVAKFPDGVDLLKRICVNKEMSKAILSQVNQQDQDGNTALHILMDRAFWSKNQVINITPFNTMLSLLDSQLKINPLIRNKNGELASELLKEKFKDQIQDIKNKELNQAMDKIATKILGGSANAEQKEKIISSLKKANKDGKYDDLYKKIATDYPNSGVYKKFISDCKQEAEQGKTFKLGKGYQSYLDLKFPSIINNLKIRLSEEHEGDKLLNELSKKTTQENMVYFLAANKGNIDQHLEKDFYKKAHTILAAEKDDKIDDDKITKELQFFAKKGKTHLHQLIETFPESKTELNNFLENEREKVKEIVNFRDQDGNTAAHLLMAKITSNQYSADLAEHNEILVKLVNSGANLTLKNNQGLTAMECGENLKGIGLNVAIERTVASCIKHIAAAIVEEAGITGVETNREITRIEKSLQKANKSGKFDGLYHKVAGDLKGSEAVIKVCAEEVQKQKSSLAEKFAEIFNKLLPTKLKSMSVTPDMKLKNVLKEHNKPRDEGMGR